MKKGYRRRYREIVKRGCGGYQDYWGEYDCHHEYDWTCDYCPCCIEAQKEQANELNQSTTHLMEFVFFTEEKE